MRPGPCLEDGQRAEVAIAESTHAASAGFPILFSDSGAS